MIDSQQIILQLQIGKAAMKKAWHIVDQQKLQYYLVQVLPHQPNSVKIPIQYQRQKYFVKKQDLLPYSPQKSTTIYDIEQNNPAQVLDWMKQAFQDSGLWLKVNKKLVIDFNINTEKQRQDYIRYVLGRFLVGQKSKQYICVSNDSTMLSKNGLIANNIFQLMQKSAKLWNHKVSLIDLNKIYNIFFRDIPKKLKVYLKNGEIIKMMIIPYNCFSKQLLGRQGSNEIMSLSAKIFNVMASSSKQIKNYYLVPYRSMSTQAQAQNLDNLTNYLLQIGLKVNEIRNILYLFSLIMNINSIQLVRGRRDDKIKYKIRDGTILKQNLYHILGEDLLTQFQLELNNIPNKDDITQSDVTLKQQLLMRVIYQQVIKKVAQILNERMCNISADLSDYKQLVVVQFPPLEQHCQANIQNYYLGLINKQIEALGLQIPFDKEAFKLKSNNFYEKIKKENNYDINKGILREMQNSIKWLDEMKKCRFIQILKNSKIDTICQSISKLRVGNIQDLAEQLYGLKKGKDIFVNFIIQTSVNQKKLPARKDLIPHLQQCINKKRQMYRKSLKSPKSDNYSQFNPQNYNQQQDFDDILEIKVDVFQQRYAYCQFIKQSHRKNPKKNTVQRLEQFFGKHENDGKVSQDGKKVLLSVDLYEKLQQQRAKHDRLVNKIKAQIKKAQFRNRIFSNLKKLYGKIKFNAFIKKLVMPIKRQNFMILKRHSASLKLYKIIQKGVKRVVKRGFRQIKFTTGIKIIHRNLKDKQSIQVSKKKSFNNMKDLWKLYRGIKCSNKVLLSYEKIILRKQRECFKRLNQQYQIIVNPPVNPVNYTSAPNSPRKKEEIKKQQSLPKNNVVVNNQSNPNNFSSVPSNPQKAIQNKLKPIQNNQQNKPSPAKKQESPPSPSVSKLPPPPPPPPQVPNTNPTNLAKKQTDNISQNNSERYNYQSNDNSSFGNSTNRGIQKSQISRKMTQNQFLSIKDKPKFSLQTWMKQAIGFQKRKPLQVQNPQVAKDLFNKKNQQREPHKQPPQQLNVDILIKQKVVMNPFFPYLMEHITAQTQQKMQKIMSHQSKPLKQPILSLYPKEKYPNVPAQTFNNILKIGRDKNTSRPVAQLLNLIVKPIRDTYYNEKNNISTVFQGQPAIIVDYSWDHNLIKDEIFMEFIKQIMMNQNEQSLYSLASGLQIITRYYYPSPKFIYPFLHFLKSLQSKNIEKLNQCFTNTLLFAQVYERYKGSNVTVLKQQIFPKEKQSHPCLEPRISQISTLEVQGYLKISMRLLNEEIYQFTIRNQTLSHFKRKVLKKIELLNYQQYFGVYYAHSAKANHYILNQSKKAVDFLNQNHQTKTEHLLYIKLKNYFPFNIKQVNKTRIMYLNSIYEQRFLPWRVKDYQSIVVLSMLFDEFEEQRISNYLVMTNQVEGNVDLSPIQNKYSQIANSRGKKICEIQYFKEIKQCGFLGAKAYRMKYQPQDSFLSKINKIVIKPLELCFYSGQQLRASFSLQRIRGQGLERGQLHLQIDYVDQDNHRGMRNLTLKNVDRIHELHLDLAAYIGYLSHH